ncbi:MAG TPA: trypsin-like serine protease [Solirubrobacteraceae bacterium]|jgi:hypothetical protein
MIARVSRALRLCVLATAGSWLVLASAAGAPTTSLRAHAAIVGGAEVSIMQAPWQVAVEALLGEEELLCGGSIIDESHILTAAHCVFDSHTGEVIPPEDFIVRAGFSTLASHGGVEEQERAVTDVRPHPYYVYAPDSGRVNPDDVAILTLEQPLVLGLDVTPIALVVDGMSLPEGTAVDLTGFGQENPAGPPDGKLNSLHMTLGYARECGGENDAVLLCASGPAGTACDGDSGSALTLGSSPALVGVMDDGVLVSGQRCSAGAENALANVAAPEIQDFIDGDETPPRAPRGGGAVLFEKPINDGSMGCEPGHWSEGPTFLYTFIDSDGQILQRGASSTYPVPPAELGHEILCQVQAINAGGTGIGRTPGLSAIAAAPVPPQPSAAVEGTTAPSTSATSSTLGPDEVSLAHTQIAVQGSGAATVELRCKGPAAGNCSGKLTVTVTRTTVEGRGRANAKKPGGGRKTQSTATTIGTATFSISAGKAATVPVTLDTAGRALLKGDRGKLSATLTIVESPGGSTSTRREGVRLVLQRAHGAHGRSG